MAESASSHDAALALFRWITVVENKTIHGVNNTGTAPSRDWILTTYAQCLRTANDPASYRNVLSMEIPK
jgi:hypothetical protein